MSKTPRYGTERPPDEDIARWGSQTLPNMRTEMHEVERKAAEWRAKGRSLRSIHRFENRASMLKLLIAEKEAELAYWTSEAQPIKPPALIGCVACGAAIPEPYGEGCCRSCYIAFHAANNPHRLTAAEWAFAESQQLLPSKKQ